MLDVDDTTLWNYDMEDGAMHFDYDPTLQNTWVQEQKFPAVPGMVEFVDKAAKLGYTVFGLTGRNNDQEPATLANLTKVGYGTTFTADTLFTKWTGKPGSTAAVVHHLRHDQLHDRRVQGRHPRATSRAPRAVATTSCSTSATSGPTSRAGTPPRCSSCPTRRTTCRAPTCRRCPSRAFVPRNVFTMEADGSSGETEPGEGIPNFDSVKATIRAYYNAPGRHREQERPRATSPR